MRRAWMDALLDDWDYRPMLASWNAKWRRHPIGCRCPTYCGPKTSPGTCAWPGCGQPNRARRRCEKHYKRWQRRKWRIERNAGRN